MRQVQKKWIKTGVYLTMIMFCIGYASAGYQVGDVVSDFTLFNVDSELVSLSDFAGDVFLLNFWRDG